MKLLKDNSYSLVSLDQETYPYIHTYIQSMSKFKAPLGLLTGWHYTHNACLSASSACLEVLSDNSLVNLDVSDLLALQDVVILCHYQSMVTNLSLHSKSSLPSLSDVKSLLDCINCLLSSGMYITIASVVEKGIQIKWA